MLIANLIVSLLFRRSVLAITGPVVLNLWIGALVVSGRLVSWKVLFSRWQWLVRLSSGTLGDWKTLRERRGDCLIVEAGKRLGDSSSLAVPPHVISVLHCTAVVAFLYCLWLSSVFASLLVWAKKSYSCSTVDIRESSLDMSLSNSSPCFK